MRLWVGHPVSFYYLVLFVLGLKFLDTPNILRTHVSESRRGPRHPQFCGELGEAAEGYYCVEATERQ